MRGAVFKAVEPTQNIRSSYARLRALASWFVIISAALWVLLPDRSQAGVVVTTIFTFDGTNGAYPTTPLIQGPNGSFYATQQGGGAIPQARSST